MEDKRKRMEELVARLNRAGRAYYQESRELISNQEYDYTMNCRGWKLKPALYWPIVRRFMWGMKS